MSSLFGEPKVDMTRGPVASSGASPSGVSWDKGSEAPISGSTPAARHASATGAMAATPHTGTRAKRLMQLFLSQGQLTIASAAELLGIKEGSVTGPWRRLERDLGWIEGTGTFYTYALANGRPIRREYHRLTAAGRAVAIDLGGQQGGRR